RDSTRLTQTEPPPTRGMLAASSANMIRTGMLMISVISSTPLTSAPGKATSVKKIEYAIVDPIGAEITALKIVASTADASRTKPVLLRTKRLPALLPTATATPTLAGE